MIVNINQNIIGTISSLNLHFQLNNRKTKCHVCMILPSSHCLPLCSRGSCHRSTGISHWGSSVCEVSHWWRRWWGWRSCRGVYRLCAVQLLLGPGLFPGPNVPFSCQVHARGGAYGGGGGDGGGALGDRGGAPHPPSGWLPSCRAGEASPLK